MRKNKDEKRGWILVAIFLLIGLLCVILTGNLAIRLAPRWSLNADMRSRLNPDDFYSTLPPRYVFQPLDTDILTSPAWLNIYLTPGLTFPSRTPKPTSAPTEVIPPTQVPATIPPTALPTHTLVWWPLPASPTPYPASTKTAKPPASTATPTTGSIPAATLSPTTSGTPPPGTSAAPTLTPSNVPLPGADLQITVNDGLLVYAPNSRMVYTVVVSNGGPDPVTGAQVSATFPIQQVASWSWSCASQDNGASGCDPAGNGNGNFSDVVNLPSGASITYSVTAIIRGNPSGNLSVTASIKEPATVLDPVQGNNAATDTDSLSYSLPYLNIGTSPDGRTEYIRSGTSITLAFNSPLVVNGHPSWDLVFYELPIGTGIGMDWTLIQIGDGTNWYNVFYWGDGIPDTNSNLNINVIGGAEDDNRDFTTQPASDVLYPFNTAPGAANSGIAMELDGVVPKGTYPYIRIVAPTGDLDGGTEIDAVSVLP
ncbi:MAG: hypothetical protein ACM3XO_20740 [Bacteroidota bacterium]